MHKIKLQEFKLILLENNEIKKAVIKLNQHKTQMFLNYIKQEIDFTKTIAFVDINGSGRTQDNLAELISPYYNKKIFNFYMNTQTNAMQNDMSIKCTYVNSANYLACCLELLSRTKDGQTIGYKYNEQNKIIPIKEFEINQAIIDWGYDNYLKGVLDYAKEALEVEKDNNLSLNSADLYFCFIEYIYKILDKKTADILGSIPFSIYSGEIKTKQAAGKYSLKNIFHKSDFPYISLARCTKIMKLIYKPIYYMLEPKTYGYISRMNKLAYLKIGNIKIDIRHLIWKN